MSVGDNVPPRIGQKGHAPAKVGSRLRARALWQAGGVTRSPDRAPGSRPPEVEELPRFAALVLAAVEQVPAGSVVTYGDVAELVGEGGPRQVGAVLSRYGSDVPWWRVLRADGTAAPQVAERALARWRREGTPLRPDGVRVDLRAARWDGG